MKRWLVVGAVVVAAVLSLGLVTWAVERGPWGHGFGDRRSGRMGPRILALLDNERFKSQLGLSDEQAGRLRQIVVGAEKSSIQTRAQIQVRSIELRELLRSDKPDRDAVMKKVQEISSLRGQIMQQHIDALLAAKAVLTPEQQKKARELLERRHGRFLHGPSTEHHGVPGPPPEPSGKAPNPPEDN